jgi:hypothetical protein
MKTSIFSHNRLPSFEGNLFPCNGCLRAILLHVLAGALTAGTIAAGTGSGEFHASLREDLFVELKGFRGFSVKEFNRVDGFVPSFQVFLRSVEEGRYPSLGLTVLYHVEREKPGWHLALEKSFFDLSTFLMRFEVFQQTDTSDRWRMSDIENSVAAFLFKEDFRDYFESEGVRISLQLELGFFHQITVDYTGLSVGSTDAGNPFTLFGWSKEFRQNPAVIDGTDASALIGWRYDSRDNMRFPRRGWFNEVAIRTAPSSFDTDFSYRLMTAHLRRYNVIFGRHFLNVRLSLGLGSDTLPPHRKFSLGGIGTLRGFPDLSEQGANFLLGNIEYRFPIRTFNWKPLRMLFNDIQGLFFLDAGNAWTDEWRVSDLKTDIGAGLSGANIFSYFGVYVAQAVGEGDRNPRVTIKMERDF